MSKMTNDQDKSATVKPVSEASMLSDDSGSARWGSDIQSKVEQGALKRFAILRSAAELFNERGFYETSLNELAKRLNVTKPSLYYYVKNKEDILRQILNQVTSDELTPIMMKVEQSNLNGLEKLRIFITEYTMTMTGVFGKCMVLSGIGPLAPSNREELTLAFRQIDNFARKILDDGVQDGSISPCDTKITAFTLFGAMHWLAKWHKPDGTLTPREIGEKLFTNFEFGLSANQAKKRKN
jgi:AcrR family transcriptional regulator